MNDEFRISPAAQLMQIHAQALAVGIDAEGKDAVDDRE
jgi:hypothetical protein